MWLHQNYRLLQCRYMSKPTFSRRNPERKRRPSTLTIPQRVDPRVQLVFAEMRRQNVTYDDVEEKSGVLRTTVKAWRTKNKPGLESIDAVFGYLGWAFVPIPRERALPPELVAELRPIADRLGLTMPATIEALAAIAAGIPRHAPPAAA